MLEKIVWYVFIVSLITCFVDWALTATMLQVKKRHKENFMLFFLGERNPLFDKWLNRNDGWMFWCGIWVAFASRTAIIIGLYINAVGISYWFALGLVPLMAGGVYAISVNGMGTYLTFHAIWQFKRDGVEKSKERVAKAFLRDARLYKSVNRDDLCIITGIIAEHVGKFGFYGDGAISPPVTALEGSESDRATLNKQAIELIDCERRLTME